MESFSDFICFVFLIAFATVDDNRQPYDQKIPKKTLNVGNVMMACKDLYEMLPVFIGSPSTLVDFIT